MIGEIWFLRGIMFLVLVVGGIISYYAYKSWTYSQAKPLLFLAVGFGTISLAAACTGIVFEVLSQGDYLTSWIVSAGLMLAGFILILYSLLIGQLEIPPALTP